VLFLQLNCEIETTSECLDPNAPALKNESLSCYPCYNERGTIEKIVEAVRSAPLEHREIIVVDDCSQDGTRTVLQEKLSQIVDQIIIIR
jgi:cellulose synthase/poly-beta-1,6-N-acetylglucosamine synthase-like glycosyltransferase